MRQRLAFLARLWERAPARLRQGIVLLFGGTIILLGLALVVCPDRSRSRCSCSGASSAGVERRASFDDPTGL